jgi:geranylgeranyl diphosphate synthase type I
VTVEKALQAILSPRRAPPGIAEPWRHVSEYARRPGKRLRPALVAVGWKAARGEVPPPRGVQRFGAGLELLHTFFLVHDDIADRADTRRGGPALHLVLGAGRLGENLAVVAGDLLFVEAVDALLACGLPNASRAVREVLAICRDTAAGQYLDLAFADADPDAVPPSAARRAEMLKTARYSFEAPLVAGALLAHGGKRVITALRAVARPLGLAFQLQDDLLPLRQGDNAGKPALADLAGGKKTWLMTLAHRALDDLGKVRLRRCVERGDSEALAEVALLLRSCGAMERVEREVCRLCAASRKAARTPALAAVREELEAVIERVAKCP